MPFIVYDKDGKAHKITHAIDYKTAIKGGCFTAEPVKKAEGKPASNKEKKEILKLADKNGIEEKTLVDYLKIESIDDLTKDLIPIAEEFLIK